MRKETLLKIFAAVAFVGVVLFYLFAGFSRPPEESSEGSATVSSSQETSSAQPEAAGEQTASFDDTYTGTLVLVNKDTLLPQVSEDGLVMLCDEKADTYRLRDNTLQLQSSCIEDLNRFLTDAKEQGGISSLVVLSAFRTFDYQQNLYEAELREKGEEGKNWVAPPGGSEHHTGLCFDLAVASKGELTKISDHSSFSWIPQHCAEYGFILRYDKDKTEITGFNYEPWHFRYVGLPHSVYMAENGLCLEEYIGQLQNTSPQSPLVISAAGASYTVYRIPVAQGETVSVPEGAVVSGDNCSGIIVTMRQ